MASVHSISLQNYRNYEQQTVSFSDGVNLIYGENAQGKTNLLESVFLFSAGKSHRNVKDAQLIRTDAEFSRLVLSFCMNQKDKTAEMHLFHDRRKEIKIDGNKIARLYELMGAFLARSE
ncbi:MAG: AAA family ATPase, partial [Clostridia bacterium]|nr:AAA family ATPase [Clostridia bacterium]